ncbi:MAG: HD domain-containing protein [Candidatus Levybacteria bacterium]|nr:HD domain-containing protein [Candidatus Levybacteria bacterium]
MKSKLKDFHHYKGSGLTRFEKVEKKVIEHILSTKIPDQNREDSQTFEFLHASGCMQVGKILAQKRNLDVNLAGTACVLHDIFVIINGTYKNHGIEGAAIAEKILREIGGFPEEEIRIITQAVAHHSEKEVKSNDPYTELVKDADVFENSLYKNAEGFYRIHKPPHIFQKYVKRIIKVRNELNLPEKPIFQ